MFLFLVAELGFEECVTVVLHDYRKEVTFIEHLMDAQNFGAAFPFWGAVVAQSL